MTHLLAGERLTAARLNRLRPATYFAAASAQLVGPQTDTDITDATITLTTETDAAVVLIQASVLFIWVSNTGLATVECWQGSTPLSGKAQIDPDSTAGRSTHSQQWHVNPGAAGSYTFKLVAEQIATDMTIGATSTTITCVVYEEA